jgi:putative ABC transport system ATP-binding protein
MDTLKICYRARQLPQHLSGGQYQRTAIACAVLSRPKLILADEPTGTLDTASGEEVMQLLIAINAEGTTVVMSPTAFPTPSTPIESLTSWTVPTRVS